MIGNLGDRPRQLEINREVKEEWCGAYLKGVSRFPQGFFGTSTYIAGALLKTGIHEDLDQLSHSRLSQEQLTRVARAAESHHKKQEVILPDSQRDISVDPHTPSDDAISHTWEGGSGMAQQRLYEFQDILTNGAEIDPDLMYATKYDITKNPEVLAQMKKAVDAIIDVLNSPEGEAISDAYVHGIAESKDRTRSRNRGLGLEAHAKLMPLFYEKLVHIFPEAEYPHIARQLAEIKFPNDWQATDDMLRPHDNRHG